MSRPSFPFAAIVGLDDLRLALQLAAIDLRLSVLVRGDKGAGKTTAARALAPLLADEGPFVNLPIGVTEDRLLGGLDLDRTLRGEPTLRPGLLAAAHGGVLYVDEVNLLPDHLADALLDAVASGVHVVEREGLSAEQDAAFVLIGSMNPEEGTLRPQLLDRFALVVDVMAPMDPAMRRVAVERRLAFDADPVAFTCAWQDAQTALAHTIREARGRVSSVAFPSPLLDYVSARVSDRGVRSLRADLAIVRASRARAALNDAATVTVEHIEAVLPLALHHRLPPGHRTPPSAPHAPAPRTQEQPPSASQEPSSSDAPQDGPDDGREVGERVFDPRAIGLPAIPLPESPPNGTSTHADGGSARRDADGIRRGAVVRARSSATPQELDLRATLVRAIGQTGNAQIGAEHLQEKVRAAVGRRRYLFVVDSSGSHAAHRRMELVKGAVAGLLERSLKRHDEVAVIVFRGTSADVLVQPTSDVEHARTALGYVPTGGRTPLAHALELAAGLITDDTALILLTDGRANVPFRSADAWADALDAASRITCAALVIDSESGPNPTGRARQLADRLRGSCVALDEL